MVICFSVIIHIMKRNIIFTENSEYGLIEVADTLIDGEHVRICYCDGYMQSGIYLDEEKKDELLFPYMQRFSYAFALNPDIRSVLLVGGGTFAYPLYFLDHYRRCRLKVIEISAEMIRTAYDYFGLDELDIEEKSNLSIVNEDAFSWLSTSDEKFDWIINDAFIGNDMQGRKENALSVIASHLNPEGIYMENMVASVRGPFSLILSRTEKKLRQYFESVEKMRCDETMSVFERQNILITCRKRGICHE